MDYKEKYRKALEIAKDYHDKGGAPLILEVIFPELKESEDERMKGAIIATIHLYYGEPLEDEAKEMISWIEKQGGQNTLNADKVIEWMVNRHLITPNEVCYCLSKDDIKEFKKDFGL